MFETPYVHIRGPLKLHGLLNRLPKQNSHFCVRVCGVASLCKYYVYKGYAFKRIIEQIIIYVRGYKM